MGIGTAPQGSERRINQATARELMPTKTPYKPFLFRFFDIYSRNLETAGTNQLEDDHDNLAIPHFPISQTCPAFREF